MNRWERDHLRFRDCLRANDDLRAACATLIRVLAAQYPNDRLGYAEAKSAFIVNALRAAG